MKKITINLAKFFLTIVLMLNIAVINTPISDNQNAIENQTDTQEAYMPWWPNLHIFKANYNQYGEFIGCYGKGSDCIAIPAIAGTITISDDGLNVQ